MLEKTATKNGVQVQETGTSWRAIGSNTVQVSQVLDYVDRNGNKTGVKYAIGPDVSTGHTAIAYVDYPKDVWSKEDVETSPEIPIILQRCNVCSAMDQLAQSRQPSAAMQQPLATAQPNFGVAVPNMASAEMGTANVPASASVSVGQVVQPKYIPFLYNISKKMVLSDVGDAVVSVGASLLADVMSGWASDPGQRDAWKCMSDGFMDGVQCSDATMTKCRQDMLKMIEAYQQDGDLVAAAKKGLFKSLDQIKQDGLGVEVTSSKQVTRRFGARPVKNVSLVD